MLHAQELLGMQWCAKVLVTNLHILPTLKVSEFWKNVYKSDEMQT